MPNIASAKKNMRKSRAATVRNRAQRSALRTALKKAKAPTATEQERDIAMRDLVGDDGKEEDRPDEEDGLEGMQQERASGTRSLRARGAQRA